MRSTLHLKSPPRRPSPSRDPNRGKPTIKASHCREGLSRGLQHLRKVQVPLPQRRTQTSLQGVLRSTPTAGNPIAAGNPRSAKLSYIYFTPISSHLSPHPHITTVINPTVRTLHNITPHTHRLTFRQCPSKQQEEKAAPVHPDPLGKHRTQQLSGSSSDT